MRSYDALGRLSATQNLQVVPDTVLPDRAFTYDALGNILTQTDANSGHTGSVSLSYGTTDPDRVCGLAYGTDTAPQAPNCNVTYDGAGNILTMPKRNGGTRSISYFPNGSVSSMADGASNATFSYDAFGSLQQLTINSTLADQRADKYFGAFVKQRIEGAQSVTNRRIPLPGGTATRHGPTQRGYWQPQYGSSKSHSDWWSAQPMSLPSFSRIRSRCLLALAACCWRLAKE